MIDKQGGERETDWEKKEIKRELTDWVIKGSWCKKLTEATPAEKGQFCLLVLGQASPSASLSQSVSVSLLKEIVVRRVTAADE